MENRDTNNPWKNALEGAEASPSDGVWSAIESDLIAAENVKMKRSVVLYQRLAAASVILVLLMGSYLVYFRGGEDPKPALASGATTAAPTSDKEPSASPSNPVAVKPATDNNSLSQVTPSSAPAEGSNSNLAEPSVKGSVNKKRSGTGSVDSQRSLAKAIESKPKRSGDNEAPILTEDESHVAGALANKTLSGSDQHVASANVPAKTEPNSVADKTNTSVAAAKNSNEGNPDVAVTNALTTNAADRANSATKAAETSKDVTATQPEGSTTLSTIPEAKLVAAVAADSAKEKPAAESPIRIKEQEKILLPWEDPRVVVADAKRNESLWASVGGSAGVYNPGVKTSTVNGIQSGSSSSKNTVGPAWSFGAAVAGKVLPRWVVQGGVNYINQSIGSTANVFAAAGPPVASTQIKGYTQAYNAVAAGSSTALTSTLEFISVPMQAGYLVLDRKVGFMLSAGVSSNFFVRNSISDQSGQAPSFSTGPGSESPYRTMSWSGLMSTELSYRLAKQYRFALVPGMRYALNSSTKAGGDRPYVMDIGFRVRYDF